MKKKISIFIACILLINCVFVFTACDDNNDMKDRPVYVGYSIGGRVIMLNHVLRTRNATANRSPNIDVNDFDMVVETGETFEIDFIVRNPQRDTILSVTLDDSYLGNNIIFSSQSAQYRIIDITTRYYAERENYYTYVRLVIPSAGSENERVITVRHIEFLRDVIREVLTGQATIPDNTEITTVNVFTKIPVAGLVLSALTTNLVLNAPVELTTVINPNNVTFNTVTYNIVNDTEIAKIVNNRYIKLIDNTRVETIQVQATVDGYVSNVLTFRPETILIYTAEELRRMHTLPNQNFILQNDIDLKNQLWEPIRNFTGIFDGQSYIISNVSTHRIASNWGDKVYCGFFAHNSGTLQNIILDNMSITADAISSRVEPYFIGGLVGYNSGTIINSSVSVDIRVFARVTSFNIGGIAGLSTGEIIRASAVSNFMISAVGWNPHPAFVGGIAGTTEGRISESFARLSVNYGYLNQMPHFVGGIVGGAQNDLIIERCHAEIYRIANPNRFGGILGGTHGLGINSRTRAEIVDSYTTSPFVINSGINGISEGGFLVNDQIFIINSFTTILTRPSTGILNPPYFYSSAHIYSRDCVNVDIVNSHRLYVNDRSLAPVRGVTSHSSLSDMFFLADVLGPSFVNVPNSTPILAWQADN
ncbi:MAG: hypothetical protein FWC80_07815 [Firmicutes bacterium]|nr:hypothetical protein [Bacillota bacterium]